MYQHPHCPVQRSDEHGRKIGNDSIEDSFGCKCDRIAEGRGRVVETL